MEIIEIPIEKIKPYPNNPRENAVTVQALKKSIRRYGFNQPIVVDKNYVIIKGHARYQACKELGMEVIPAVISKLSVKKNDADRVLDNKIHDLSTWDKVSLMVEMRDIEEAISSVIGSDIIKGYSEYEPRAITNEQVVEAEGAMREHPVREYITVICECGSEMLLSKNAVEGLV